MISSVGRNRKRAKFCELEISGLSHEGRGISERNGKTIFVDGALPGEKVIARIIKKRSRFDEAQVAEILISNENRIDPRCRHFGVCGGCSLQHMNEGDQINHKQSVLLELLKHQSAVVPEKLLPPISSNQWGYRQKARLGVKWVKGKNGVVVGFREKFKGFVTDSTECEVLDPRVGKKIIQLRMLLQSLSISDRIPQLEIATTKDTVSIVIRHLSPFSAEDLDVLKCFGRKHEFDFYLQSEGVDSIFALENTFTELSYELDGIEIGFKPTDFTQINSGVNYAMVKKVIELLDPKEGDEVLDLFCGIGNFSLAVAARGAKVTGLEIDVEMVEQAKMNAYRNKITNCSFLAIDLQDVYKLQSVDACKINKVLLDPPRSGAKETLAELKLPATEKVLYVSCNPMTFSRDAGILKEMYGFGLSQLGILDMFPHTSHFECIGLFER